MERLDSAPIRLPWRMFSKGPENGGGRPELSLLAALLTPHRRVFFLPPPSHTFRQEPSPSSAQEDVCGPTRYLFCYFELHIAGRNVSKKTRRCGVSNAASNDNSGLLPPFSGPFENILHGNRIGAESNRSIVGFHSRRQCRRTGSRIGNIVLPHSMSQKQSQCLEFVKSECALQRAPRRHLAHAHAVANHDNNVARNPFLLRENDVLKHE